ncbi:MAG: response regulator [Acidimicrobiia bacterium]
MPTVFLVDDHAIARAGTRALLAGFDVVGEAASAAEAVEGILAAKPDAALVDVHMDQRRDGARVVQAVKEADPEIVCVALSVSQSRGDVVALFAAGVDGYLTKRVSTEALSAAVYEAIDGGNPVSPEVAQYMLEIDDVAGQLELIDRLTPREREVVILIAQGYTYRQSASKLGMKVKTLETHMSHIFEKLGVATRAELSFLAYETDMVDPRDGRD